MSLASVHFLCMPNLGFGRGYPQGHMGFPLKRFQYQARTPPVLELKTVAGRGRQYAGGRVCILAALLGGCSSGLTPVQVARIHRDRIYYTLPPTQSCPYNFGRKASGSMSKSTVQPTVAPVLPAHLELDFPDRPQTVRPVGGERWASQACTTKRVHLSAQGFSSTNTIHRSVCLQNLRNLTESDQEFAIDEVQHMPFECIHKRCK